MNERLDCMGFPVNIGDWVIYSGPGVGLEMGKVKDFTKLRVKIGYNVQYANELLVISESQAKAFMSTHNTDFEDYE